MKETFNHKLFWSFALWFENQLLANGEAFQNKTGIFYPQNDASLPAYSVYASQYKQFVYDSAIVGANIISGVYPIGSSTFIPRGTSGLQIDYQNGRIFFDSGVNHPAGFSGSFAQKEFNTYITKFDSEQFIFEQAKGNNKNLNYPASGIQPRIYKAPCAILTLPNSENVGFAFGGEDKTESTIRAVIISKDLWQQDGILSIFQDTNLLPFPLVASQDVPLNFFGDVKSGYYNYNEMISRYGLPGTMPWINKVYTAKVSEDGNKNDNYYVSYLEFDINTVRYPRIRAATNLPPTPNYYIKYLNTDYTVQRDDYYLAVNANTPAKTITFTQSNFSTGWGYVIKDYLGMSETNPITLTGAGITFDYQPSLVISGNMASVNLIAGSGYNYEVN
jgi:hypothetical protein